jgi:hypothetical protein
VALLFVLLYLFPLLWGALISLILCAPYEYYPLFLIALGVSIVFFVYSKRFFSKLKIKYYLLFLIPILISYSLCSFIIFKPTVLNYKYNKNVSINKKAVIFYCKGEMEKYSPKYANYFFKNCSFLLKPFYAAKLKNLYKDTDIKSKNSSLLLTARAVKNSIINYKPYYFYIAFAYYYPDIKASIQDAINDGCSDITILNYTNNSNIENELSSTIHLYELRNSGIAINFTPSVYTADSFAIGIVSQIDNMSIKYDGILILDNVTDTSAKIKAHFSNLGYEDKFVIISTDVDTSMKYFIKSKKNNILYINLVDSDGYIPSEMLLIKKFEKYNDSIKISGINNWGYDKYIVKAAIEALKK